MLYVDKNVPLPPNAGKGGIRPKTEISKILEALEIGDSVLIPKGEPAEKARNLIGPIRKRTGFSFVRKMYPGGLRIWRTA